MTDSFTYSGFAEVDSYTANVNASPVFSNSFLRDKLGRISQKTETAQGVTHVFDYTYDTAGRLTDVDRDSLPFASYTYDSNGNRLNNGAIYDDQDRLTTSAGNSYAYTANGELLTKANGSGTTTYSYDVLGNLISVILPSGTTIEYLVDGKNRRIGKKVNGTLERAWLYKDGLNPIAELDGTGTIVSRFVYATRSNVPDFIIKGGVTYRMVSDHLGSPRLVVDTTTGTVIQTMDFDEWGNVIADTNPEFQPFGFGGGLYDTDTQLVRFGARDYDPDTGRWTSKDPIGFNSGDTSFFGFVLNDPINLIDPSGLKKISSMRVNQTQSTLTINYQDGTSKTLPAATGDGAQFPGSNSPGSGEVDRTAWGPASDLFRNTSPSWQAGNKDNPYGPAMIILKGLKSRHIHGTNGPMNGGLDFIGGTDSQGRQFTHGCARIQNVEIGKLKRDVDETLKAGGRIPVRFK